MIESLLVVDDGLGAARVIASSQRLGVKAVLLTTADRASRARDADDVMMLSGPELASAAAVSAAAGASEVDAIHPAMGPLRASTELLERAAAAGLRVAVTTGTLARPAVKAALRAEGVGYRRTLESSADVLVFGSAEGVIVLGDLRTDAGLALAPAPLDPAARELAHRCAHAAATVLDIRGLASISVALSASVSGAAPGTADVVAVRAGLRPRYVAWETVSGVDLVETQLRALQGESPIAGSSATPATDGAAASTTVDTVDTEPAAPSPPGRFERYLGSDGRPHGRLTVWAPEAEQAIALIRAAG